MGQELYVGSLVSLKHETFLGNYGDFGVCCAVHQFGADRGYSFVFERGPSKILSADEIDRYIVVSEHVSSDAARYQFSDEKQLYADYREGRFDAAFDESYRLTGCPLWPEAEAPPLSHPREVTLERHGTVIEAEIMNQLRGENAEPVKSETHGQRPATALSSLDRRAHAAYEEYCKLQQTPTTEAGRNEWVTAWRELAEEQRQDAVDMEREQAPRWPKAEPQAHDHDPDVDLDR